MTATTDPIPTAVDPVSTDQSQESLLHCEPPAAVISTTAFETLDSVVPGYTTPPLDETVESNDHIPIASKTTLCPASFVTGATLLTADLLALTCCFVFATVFMLSLTGWIVPSTFIYQFAAAAIVYVVISKFFGLYPGSGMSPPFELRQVVSAVALTFFAILVANMMFGRLSRGEAVSVISGALASVVVVPVFRSLTRSVLSRYQWWGERVVIAGATKAGHAIYRFLKKNPHRGLRPVGIIDESHHYWQDEAESEAPYLGNFDDLQQVVQTTGATWAIAAVASRSPEEVTQVLNRCSMMPHLLFLPSRAVIPSLWTKSQECGGVAGLHIEDRLLRSWPRFIKRVGDIVVASAAILGLSPVFLTIALWTKWKSPGPVFYGHTRIGRGGQRFKAWKFRSMVMNADKVLQDHLAANPELQEEWDRDQKLKNDPRIVPGIGNIIRKTSLDELPQLWNVIKGEMSLVGPRPIVDNEIQKYKQAYPLYLRVRPGITGVWQVSGRNNTTYESRVTFDNYYVRNWSIWLDIYVLLRTVKTVALREGAY